MGILGKLFGGKDNSKSDERPSGGSYLVEDTFRINIPQDLVVVGQIKGTVRAGDKVYIEGADEVILILVKELEIFRTKVHSSHLKHGFQRSCHCGNGSYQPYPDIGHFLTPYCSLQEHLGSLRNAFDLELYSLLYSWAQSERQ